MLRLQPAHGQVVQNAVLHLLQIVVIGVEDLLRLRDVDLDTRRLLPRQHRQPLDVVAGEAVVGSHGRHARQAAKLLQRFFLHVVGHARGFDLLAQLFGIARGLVLLAQFLLDGLHLLAQVVLALRLLHPVLHFALDLVAQLLDLQLLGQVLVDLLQPHVHIGRLQHILLVASRERGQRRGNEVDHAAGIVNVAGDGRELIRQRRRAGDDLLEQRQHVALQALRSRRSWARLISGMDSTRGAHERRQLRVFGDLHALQALGEDEQALVGHAHHFVHHRQAADGEQVGGLGSVDARLALRHHNDGLVLTQRINQLNRAFAADGQRQHRVREQNGVAHGQNRQRAGLFRIVAEFRVSGLLNLYYRLDI